MRDERARRYVVEATKGVASLVRSTLGPRGMEKLIQTIDPHDEPELVLTADGGEILAAIKRGEGFNHPVAALFVDCVDSMQRGLDDGTTTAMVDVEFHRNGDGSGVLSVDDAFTYGVSTTFVSTLGESASDRYRLGIRPENVQIDTSAPADKTIEATVEVVEVVGSDNFIYVDIGGREARLRTSSEIEPETGDVIDVTFPEDDIHLFDPRTGRAVLHGHSKETVETDAESAEART
jgi:hypothetical protein